MATSGTIIQVIGSTFDAQFSADQLPKIYNAVSVEVDNAGEKITLVGEVNKHLGGGRVRCVSLGSTDGLRRGQPCDDLGSPVTVPVGECVLGRVFNLFGEPVDERGSVQSDKRMPIHASPPLLSDLNPKNEILETGIKVVDLLCPFVRGGKDWLVWWCGCWQDSHHSRNDCSCCTRVRWLFSICWCGRANTRRQRPLA